MRRRTFLKMTAATAAGVALSACGSEDGKGRARTALVVGTGFGGSVSALRLAEAGLEVTVLERGRRWPVTDAEDTFPSVFEPDRRSAWMATSTTIPGLKVNTFERYAGLLEAIEGDGLRVIAGAGVGGNSLVFGGIMIQPQRAVFEQVFPAAVDYGEMERVFYPRVRAMMRTARIPDDILGSDPYLSTRVWLDQCRQAGFEPEIIENALDWDLVRAELEGRKRPQAIRGDYNFGLNSGAKNSLDRTYLAEAEATGRVDVRPLHVVQRVFQREDRWAVEADRIDEDGEVMETVRLEADVLFMGAGSMGTTRLLLNARDRGDLPGLDEQVGQGFGNNGQVILFRSNVGTPTGAPQGGPPTGFLRLPDHPILPISIENGPGPFTTECGCLINIGHALVEPTGRLWLDPEDGRLRIDWDRGFNARVSEAVTQTLDQMSEATAGGLTFEFGAAGDHTTYHPLGGASMGAVCDFEGRVQGYPGLYVVDGALLPGSAATANPALTIGAIAERCLDRIIAEDLS